MVFYESTFYVKKVFPEHKKIYFNTFINVFFKNGIIGKRILCMKHGTIEKIYTYEYKTTKQQRKENHKTI